MSFLKVFQKSRICTRKFTSFSTLLQRQYTPDHEWVSITGNVATFGITEYAQAELGDVVYIEVPTKGDKVAKKDQIGAVESVKAASDIYAPLSGLIVEVNGSLEGEPSLINTSPYENGWIGKIELSDPKELENLLSQAEYVKLTT